MAATEQFYAEYLGFRRTGEWIEGDSLKWMELKHPTLLTSPLDAAPLTLWFFNNPLTHQNHATASALIYFMIENVREYADHLPTSLELDWGPEVMPYGLLELGLRDNNGYRLVFAQEWDD